MTTLFRKGSFGRLCAALLLASSVGLLWLSGRYHAPPWEVPLLAARVVAAPLLARFHAEDAVRAAALSAGYLHEARGVAAQPRESWLAAGRGGKVEILGGSGVAPLQRGIPFVFESPDAWYLKELRQRYRLQDKVRRQRGEYERMLALFAWVGTRWDHGADLVGPVQEHPPVEFVAAGEKGGRFWCQVAAQVAAQAACAMGWPSRVITASSDGYRAEHALAEVWSNQFNKWFLVDADYNIVYQSRGVPLSAYELCHFGPGLKQSGLLEVRRFAPLKAALREADLLGLYRYVHFDLRNDWYSRRLGKGSPAGGDLSTWWTARKDLGAILTPRVRVDARARFDWPVNATEIHLLNLQEDGRGGYLFEVGLRGYSPYFERFLVRMDRGAWHEAPQARGRFQLEAGRHLVEARVRTRNGELGPAAAVEFLLR